MYLNSIKHWASENNTKYRSLGCHLSHFVVITDQNFAVKGCPFQHRPRPTRDVKRVSISLFFEKKGTFFYNGYVSVLGSDFKKSSQKSSMTDFGQHVFTIPQHCRNRRQGFVQGKLTVCRGMDRVPRLSAEQDTSGIMPFVSRER